MNHYSQLLYYLKGLGEADPFVNTITKGDFTKLDLSKLTVYPLLHISIGGGQFSNGQTVLFNCEVGCFQQRDAKQQEINTDKFWENDNEVDNMNETHAVLNRIWTIAYRDFNEQGFRASEDAPIDPVDDEYANGLDGWILRFDILMPNTTINLCQ